MLIGNRVLLSLGIITVTVAVGGTVSFFSDRKTSTDNTFTAGAIGLRIDSWADDGISVGNTTQTDKITLDVSFYTEQTEHNNNSLAIN